MSESSDRNRRTVTNVEVARILEDVADLLEIDGANEFRVRAYRDGARTVEEHGVPMQKLVADGEDLTELPRIGDDLADHIKEIIETGSLKTREDLTKRIPESLLAVMALQGLGPKKTRALWKELGVETVDDIEDAAQNDKIKALDGFGKKSQEKILNAVEAYRRHRERTRLSEADALIEPLLEYLSEHDSLERIEVAGSYRRRKETVGDIDLLAIADDAEAVMEHFVSFGDVKEVRQSGDTRGTVVLSSGLQVDLRILASESYGAAMVYFTGSKAHNIALRKRANQRGLKMSEYGVFESDDDDESGERIAGETEEEVYDSVGLPWIPPVLREDRGEIDAAEKDELPDLLQLDQIRGDLQMHSDWSDGKRSIKEMVEACKERGYDYMAITDHGKSLPMTGGLDEERLEKQMEEVAQLRDQIDGIHIFQGVEVDILKDGSLEFDDDILDKLDFVLISVHSYMDLPSEEQTERLVNAVSHPKVNVMAHPTGRLINRRDPMEFDMDAVLDAAASNHVAMELNAQPDRLDLKDDHLIAARKRDIQILINTDAHSPDGLAAMSYGIDQARRAWLSKDNVLNAQPLDGLKAFFSKEM